jgi:uncharacterized protein (TIGR02246 family)
MKKSFFASIFAITTILSTPALASEKTEEDENKNAKAQYQKWAAAIKSHDAERIVDLYDDEAVLLSTFDGKPIIKRQERLKYFESLTKKKDLDVTLNEAFYEENGDIAIANGLYTFSYTENGKKVDVPARFSFVFENEPDEEGWEIESHHSSLVPAGK